MKTKTLRSFVSVLAALVMAVSLLAGCGRLRGRFRAFQPWFSAGGQRHCRGGQRGPPPRHGKRHERFFVQTHRDRRPGAGAAQDPVNQMPVRHKKIKHPRQTSQRFLTSECELPRVLLLLLAGGRQDLSTSARTCSRCGISSGFAMWPSIPAFHAF